jgi:hypothetical protein
VLGVAFMASAGLALAAPAQPDLPPARKVAVAAGATQALSGKLKGYQLADYLIPLEAGQSVVMQLRTSNPSGYFNVDARARPMARCSSAAPRATVSRPSPR